MFVHIREADKMSLPCCEVKLALKGLLSGTEHITACRVRSVSPIVAFQHRYGVTKLEHYDSREQLVELLETVVARQKT